MKHRLLISILILLLTACRSPALSSGTPTTTAAPADSAQSATARPTNSPSPLPPTPAPTSASFAPDAPPNFGLLTLQAGFLPDPRTVDVISGGAVDASSTAEGCTGFASTNPDVRVTYDGFGFLRFFFLPRGEQAAALIVRGADGAWRCIDVVGTLDFEDAPTGSYEVWVSSSTPDAYVGGALVITELRDYTPTRANQRPTAIPIADGVLDIDAEAANRLTLPRDFSPDPYPVEMTIGGRVDVPRAVSAARCAGYASAEPDLRLEWEGVGFLRFFFLAEDGSDTALAIHAPDDTWWCMDDSYGTVHPSLDLLNSAAGTYELWVSSSTPGADVPGTLFITVWDNHPGNYRP